MGAQRKILREFTTLTGNVASLGLTLESIESLLVEKGVLSEGELLAKARALASEQFFNPLITPTDD